MYCRCDVVVVYGSLLVWTHNTLGRCFTSSHLLSGLIAVCSCVLCFNSTSYTTTRNVGIIHFKAEPSSPHTAGEEVSPSSGYSAKSC